MEGGHGEAFLQHQMPLGSLGEKEVLGGRTMKTCTNHPYRVARHEGIEDPNFLLCGRCYWYMLRKQKNKNQIVRKVPVQPKRTVVMKMDVELVEQIEIFAGWNNATVAACLRKWAAEKMDEERERRQKETA